MKLLLLTILILSTTTVFAEVTTQERFYRAGDKEILVQGGVNFVRLRSIIEYDDFFIESIYDETNATEYRLETQYGISENLAIGLDLAYVSDGGEALGFRNHGIFVKGQKDSLTYRVAYYLSLEDDDLENNYKGGDYIELEVGYQIFRGWGALIKFRPAYEGDFDNGSGDKGETEYGYDYTISAHYEFNFTPQIMGLHMGYRSLESRVSGFDNINYFTTGIYANLAAGGVEFLPSIDIDLHSTDRTTTDSNGDRQDYEYTNSASQVKLLARKRF